MASLCKFELAAAITVSPIYFSTLQRRENKFLLLVSKYKYIMYVHFHFPAAHGTRNVFTGLLLASGDSRLDHQSI